MKEKMFISSLFLILVIALFITIPGCKKDKEEITLPVEGFVISPNAKLVTDVYWQSTIIDIDSSNYTLTFDKSIMNLYAFSQGDLIVSTTGNGLLRRIQSITQSGNNIQIQTTQATLTDLIQQGDLDYKTSLTISQIKSIKYHYPGILLDTINTKSTDGTLFNWDIDTEIHPQIRLQGNFQYSSNFILQIQISILQGLKKVNFGFESSEEFNLALIAGQQFTLNKQITLATVHFTPIFIPLPVPPFTIIVAPVLDIKLGLDGYANANITTSLSQEFSAETGIQYLKDEGWTSYMNYDKSFIYTPPQLNYNAGAEAYLKPELRMLIFNVIGPYLNAKGYGKIEADITQTPWWKMYYGIKMSGGAKATILNVLLFDFTLDDLLSWEQQVGQSGSNNPPSLPSNPNPANNATNVSTSTSLTWTCSDPEQDPLTYDVYFGTSSNPPLITSNQSQNSFTPTPLIASTKYYWKILAKDNHGSPTIGDVWSFTTAGSSNLPPNPPSDPDPENNATNISTLTSISWTCSDPEQDPLTYNVYFGTSSNPPLVSSNQSQAYFTPTSLNTNTTYYWKIIAKDDHQNSTAGAVWSFTTEGASGQPCPGIPTVTYGSQVYHTVQIGSQCWFKENLNIGTRINGSQNQTNNSILEKYCYNDIESNCDIYGGLYQWDEMMQYSTIAGAQGICPSGWHVPTDEEWTTLTTNLGGESVAGKKLKETGVTHWATPNTGTNESNFTALGGGERGAYGGFVNFNIYGAFWSSTENYDRYLSHSTDVVSRYYGIKTGGVSVRCLKD